MLRAPLLFVLLVASCAMPGGWTPAESGPGRTWRYEVRPGSGESELTVTGRFLYDHGGRLEVHERGLEAIGGVRLSDGRRLERDGAEWLVPNDAPRPLEVHWDVDVDRIGYEMRGRYRREPAWSVEPKTILLQPVRGAERAWVELAFDLPTETPVASGLPREADGTTYTFRAGRFWRLPYTLIGGFREYEALVDEVDVEVAILPGSFRVADEDVVEYVERCVRAVGAYYGRFPLRHGLVVVQPNRRGGYGRAMGSGGGSVFYLLDRYETREQLFDDWVLVHELLHFACPLLASEHHWLEEGLATWLEPLVRFRAGWIDEEEVWGEFYGDMRNGLPRPGDRGLDRTRSWGNTYWGGALFCMLAEIEIDRRSGGELSLRDGLRGIVEAGGNIAVGWSMEETLRTADEALGFEVLVPLWERYRHAPLDVDLDRLWRDLGVVRDGRGVRFDDEVPLADVRRRIAGDLTEPFGALP